MPPWLLNPQLLCVPVATRALGWASPGPDGRTAPLWAVAVKGDEAPASRVTSWASHLLGWPGRAQGHMPTLLCARSWLRGVGGDLPWIPAVLHQHPGRGRRCVGRMKYSRERYS